jgi:TrpR family transcriptional regulator, trp operon repressor
MKKPGWQNFITLCRRAHSDEELQALFDLLFTLDEQEQLQMRVELLKALLRGDKTQRVIAEDLQVSIAKITRGSNALKTISPELRQYLKTELKI